MEADEPLAMSIETVCGRISECTRRTVSHWRTIHTGYTPALRGIATLGDGETVFAKVATTERTAEWLRAEHKIYSYLKADFLPRFVGWHDDGSAPMLLLEDLSAAHWPPPWNPDHIERVRAMLERVHASAALAPPDLPRLAEIKAEKSGWHRVAADPAPFLSVGICSAAWLEKALPTLIAAMDAAVLEGDDLLHQDVRSDNLCFANGRTLLVDWNWACIGNGLFEVAALLPSLEYEGGPAPETILPDQPALAAWIAGYFAAHVGLPSPPGAPRVRTVQRQQISTALPWAVRALDLSPPT